MAERLKITGRIYIENGGCQIKKVAGYRKWLLEAADGPHPHPLSVSRRGVRCFNKIEPRKRSDTLIVMGKSEALRHVENFISSETCAGI